MSCSCNCSPCQCQPCCDPACEPLSSALENFIQSFFGTLTKTCVNGRVVWELPCDLDVGIPSFPRLPNEGLACYFLRWMGTLETGFSGTRTVVLTVFWNTPYLVQYKQDETWVNGRLISVGSPYVETIYIAVECP
jgi:hypothetical protein